MRTHHWLTAFLCGAFLLGTGKAEAQSPPGTAGYAQFNSHATIDAALAPTGYAYPYPAISPFDHAFEQTYNDRGLWLTERRDTRNDHASFSIEWLYGIVNRPDSDKVSYDEAPIPQAFFDNGDMSIENDDAGRFPFFQDEDTLAFKGGQGPYPPFESGLLDSVGTSGLQLKLTVERPDGMGFELNGFGMWPGMEAKETGTPIMRWGPLDDTPPDLIIYAAQDGIQGLPRISGINTGPFNNLITDAIDLDSVGAFNPAIRLFDGSALGTMQRFDLYMREEWYSEIYGAGATLLQNASRQIGPFKVRPVMGVRYLNTKELFRVEGHDSGLDYDVDFTPDALNDPSMRNSLYPGGIEGTIVVVTNPLRAYLDSQTETHMAGPEFGWQYSAGGDSFKLSGETKIGVMGANQVQTLVTKGIGQPFLIDDTVPPIAPLNFANVNPFYDPTLVTRDKKDTSYVTPTFQQSFNTTSRPFAYIPLLRSSRILREANLKAGWTFLLIGQLQRPNKQVVYQSGNGAIPAEFADLFNVVDPSLIIGDPSLIPEVKKDRSVYFLNYFNLGVEWEY